MELLFGLVWLVVMAAISIASSIAKKKKRMEMMAAAARQETTVTPLPSQPVPVPHQAVSTGDEAMKAFLSQLGVDIPEKEGIAKAKALDLMQRQSLAVNDASIIGTSDYAEIKGGSVSPAF